jgi:hypothetical protein
MKTTAFWMGLLTMLSASLASATPITIPSGLNPGDTYFLAFVTAGTRNATSSNIADYDAFVTAQANTDPLLFALGTTWRVIGSTATVDAVTHIGVTGPVYNLGGQEVATGSPDLFDGTLSAPINLDQDGIIRTRIVWTGSEVNGTRQPIRVLGSATTSTETGQSPVTGSPWVDSGFAPSTTDFSLYGMSGPLVVPTAVPEPSTISLMLAPLLLLGGRYRRWRHRLATPTTQVDPASH